MRLFKILFVCLFIACSPDEAPTIDDVFIEGTTSDEAKFLTIGEDTLFIKDGVFSDTIIREKDQYNYIKFETWKWPRIVYLQKGKPLNLKTNNGRISVNNDINDFLLNRDSILTPYSSKWDMSEVDFITTWKKEMNINLRLIDQFFENKPTPRQLVGELKQMEYMYRGHLTANFISFQEKKGKSIDRSIYNFVNNIDLNNDRLAFHVNNRNFQYYYYLDKVEESLPESVYPFAAIDTIDKYVKVDPIKKMIIKGVVRSGLYNDSVDHDALFESYEKHIGTLAKDDKIRKIYDQIQSLKPGNQAPEFGNLLNNNGDEITLNDFKGRNVLLSAWGTWCPYCREELPYLKELMMKYSDKVESVAISLDKDDEKWKTYIQQNDWNANHLIDPKRKSTFKENYLISGTNIYYLIDRKGGIVASGVKPSNSELEALILELN